MLAVGIGHTKEPKITGLWYTHENKKGVISVAEIYEENGKYYAYGFDYKTKGRGVEIYDIHNPNPALQKKPMRGLIMIFDVKKESKKSSGGFIYNPENGKTYHVSLQLKDDTTLAVRASVDSTGVFGHTLEWKRVEDGHSYKPLSKNELHLPK